MKFFRKLRNYFCYCGIEKEEYKQLKKDAYISNFEVWRVLNFLMVVAFAILFGLSFLDKVIIANRIFYCAMLIYSIVVSVVFFFIKKDSLAGQLLIYLSISILLLFGAFVARNAPKYPALTFIAFLLISPLFMIDKPYFMSLELVIASTIFLVWMYFVKDYEIFLMDLTNTLSFTFVAVFIHIIANSLRIKEFVLIHEISIQKDIDDLTGLKNKSSLTREINTFIEKDISFKQGIFIVLDIDGFKEFNDTYGHDVGDEILTKLGGFLKSKFDNDEIVGRFGGDEFIIFIKNNADPKYAAKVAQDLTSSVGDAIELPNKNERLSISMGIALYRGAEKNYSEVFKKADIALYKTKADRRYKFNINE